MECLSALKSAISEVFETMFFTSVDFDQMNGSRRSDYYRSTKIALSNDKESQSISFCLTKSFSKMISANFLGIAEEDVTEEEMEDVMRELTNMIGGNYMRRMALDAWRLGIPSLERSEAAQTRPIYNLNFVFMGERVGSVALQTESSSGQG